MATEETELAFIRCPGCRSLVPSVAARCRMCGEPLQAKEGSGEEGGDGGRRARIRQRTMSVSVNEVETLKEEIAPKSAPLFQSGQDAAKPVEATTPPPPAPEAPKPSPWNAGATETSTPGEPVKESPAGPLPSPFKPIEPSTAPQVLREPTPRATERPELDAEAKPAPSTSYSGGVPSEAPKSEKPSWLQSPTVQTPAAADANLFGDDESDDDFGDDEGDDDEDGSDDTAGTLGAFDPQGGERRKRRRRRRRKKKGDALQQGAEAGDAPAAPVVEARAVTPASTQSHAPVQPQVPPVQSHASGHSSGQVHNQVQPQGSAKVMENSGGDFQRDRSAGQPNRGVASTSYGAKPAEASHTGAAPAAGEDGILLGWLVAYDHTGKGTAREVRSGRFFISGGQLRDGDFVITHPSVSTPHCMVNATVDGLRVMDLMSERGTFVKRRRTNGFVQQTEQVTLSHGDWVRFGQYEVLVCLIPV